MTYATYEVDEETFEEVSVGDKYLSEVGDITMVVSDMKATKASEKGVSYEISLMEAPEE